MNRTGPLDPADDEFRVVEILPGNNDNDNNVVKYNSTETFNLRDIECDVLSYIDLLRFTSTILIEMVLSLVNK
jgi:hypothetical protein